MKQYYNSITKEWYAEGQSMTHKIGNSVFSGIPTQEQLTEWGFVEYIPPEPPEPTPQDELDPYEALQIITGGIEQ